MKLFQQLLVAPAALGLLAPLAVSATEVNLDNVADYAASTAAVATSAQFSDVAPGDWAYTALQNLSESYGCVDNAYTQNLNNGQSLTRYEAAALVNACLDSGLTASNEGLSPETARLTNEFASEMAILKGRVDGLETRVNEFQAGQFASSTKVSGEAVFLTGATSYDAQAANDGQNLHMKYAFAVDMDTSFTGEDALVVGFETGNTTANDLLSTESSVQAGTAGVIDLTSLYYQFPIGEFDIAVGPLLDQDDLIATTLSTYSNDGLFEPRLLGSNALSHHGETGAGISLAWNSESGLNAGVSTITTGGNDPAVGIWTEESNEYATVSVGYDGDGFGGGLVYAWSDNPQTLLEGVTGQDLSGWTFGDPSVVGVGAYFQPSESFDISFGCDFYNPDVNTIDDGHQCTLGADWEVGAGTLSGAIASVPAWNLTTGDFDEAGTSFELSYDYPLNDGVSIKPSIYTTSHDEDRFVDHTVLALETTFKF